eukprot:gene6669-13501_t
MLRFDIDIETENISSLTLPVKAVPVRKPWDATSLESGDTLGINGGFNITELGFMGSERSAFQNPEHFQGNGLTANDKKISLTPGPKLKYQNNENNNNGWIQGPFEHHLPLSSALHSLRDAVDDMCAPTHIEVLPSYQSQYLGEGNIKDLGDDYGHHQPDIASELMDRNLFGEKSPESRRTYSLGDEYNTKVNQEDWAGIPSYLQQGMPRDQIQRQMCWDDVPPPSQLNSSVNSNINYNIPNDLGSDQYPNNNFNSNQMFNPSSNEAEYTTLQQQNQQQQLYFQTNKSIGDYTNVSLTSNLDDTLQYPPPPPIIVSNSPPRQRFRRDIGRVTGTVLPLSQSDSLYKNTNFNVKPMQNSFQGYLNSNTNNININSNINMSNNINPQQLAFHFSIDNPLSMPINQQQQQQQPQQHPQQHQFNKLYMQPPEYIQQHQQDALQHQHQQDAVQPQHLQGFQSRDDNSGMRPQSQVQVQVQQQPNMSSQYAASWQQQLIIQQQQQRQHHHQQQQQQSYIQFQQQQQQLLSSLPARPHMQSVRGPNNNNMPVLLSESGTTGTGTSNNNINMKTFLHKQQQQLQQQQQPPRGNSNSNGGSIGVGGGGGGGNNVYSYAQQQHDAHYSVTGPGPGLSKSFDKDIQNHYRSNINSNNNSNAMLYMQGQPGNYTSSAMSNTSSTIQPLSLSQSMSSMSMTAASQIQSGYNHNHNNNNNSNNYNNFNEQDITSITNNNMSIRDKNKIYSNPTSTSMKSNAMPVAIVQNNNNNQNHSNQMMSFNNNNNSNPGNNNNTNSNNTLQVASRKKDKIRPSSAGKFTSSSSTSSSVTSERHHKQQPSETNSTSTENVNFTQGKGAHKEFYRQFRNKERDSVEAAREYARDALNWTPEDSKWRIILELADLAKRNNEFGKARTLYKDVCDRQPQASQVWLEWSKMEDELGNIESSLIILRKGLRQCNNFNEGLLTKAIKQQERLHNLREAREMLSCLKHQSIDRVWKAVLEGALLEARAGEIAVARKLLKYLMWHVPWYGPIYFEAFRLEEKSENWRIAEIIVRQGLEEIPRYGPLWFGYLRLMERQDVQEERGGWLLGLQPVLRRTREQTLLAVKNISRELVWKVHFEQAQAEERAVEMVAVGLHIQTGEPLWEARHALLDQARLCYVRSLLTCPENLQWKIWLAGARMELSANRLDEVRKVLRWTLNEAPEKSRSHVYLECSRVEEYIGNLHGARRILSRAREDSRCEWKIFLETVLLEARAGNLKVAIQEAEIALEQHSGTGRLWAVLVQLTHRLEGVKIYQRLLILNKLQGNTMIPKVIQLQQKNKPSNSTSTTHVEITETPKHRVLLRALREVPKSGEVWCEGARIHMNPLQMLSFDLGRAQKYLGFAIQFTPQYGDTFIEYLRLELIGQVLLPRVLAKLGIPLLPFLERFLCADEEADTANLTRDERRLRALETELSALNSSSDVSRELRQKAIVAMSKLNLDVGNCTVAYKEVTLTNLLRRCTNADPNYGTVWFFCRHRPIDNPITVTQIALDLLQHEMVAAQPIYIRAICHYVQRCLSSHDDCKDSTSSRRGRRRPDSGNSTSSSSIASTRTKTPVTLYAKLRRPSSAPTQGVSTRSGPSAPSPSSESTSTSTASVQAATSAPLSEGDSGGASTATTTTGGVAVGTGGGSSYSPSDQEDIWIEHAEKDKEVLEDFEKASSSLGSNWLRFQSEPCLPLVSINDVTYSAQDFVTSLIELNRAGYTKHLSAEERRRALFGSDQILP